MKLTIATKMASVSRNVLLIGYQVKLRSELYCFTCSILWAMGTMAVNSLIKRVKICFGSNPELACLNAIKD